MHSTPPPIATNSPRRKPVGRHLGVEFDVVAWAPGDARVDLSMACMFEREQIGASMSGGLLHLDQDLAHALSDLRAEGRFKARWLDTLLVTHPTAGMAPGAILVIGLGRPEALSEGTLERACALAVTQALRLGARSAAFAPNLLDAGITPPPDLDIAGAMVRGAVEALELADRLVSRGLATPARLQAWSFDAGMANFPAVAAAFERAFDNK